ncbi:PREDICTED: lysM domain receptor-like kinase 3 [Prunus mume]|uniref:LysM domain receptor-like kinase 3 n=1 Tax=Prunus mume TaxID=102107 RepID=A0ABM1LI13_PRUMU|nr:PREDICTED: lysM domain receptor-like kinase 3 [Prunus mume]
MVMMMHKVKKVAVVIIRRPMVSLKEQVHTTTMASLHHLPCLLLSLWLTQFPAGFASDASIIATLINPLSCSAEIMTCNASLYHINISLNKEQIASFYSVFPSEVNPIKHNSKQDYLVSVPCSCKNISGTVGYFYDTTYKVKPSDTFYDVSNQIYSGQPLSVKEELPKFVPEANFPIHLPCGCVESDSQIVVTYTVQEHDTLSDIGTLLSAKLENIENMNKNMTEKPSFIVVGWVLFVPMEKNGLKTSKTGEHKWMILIGITLAVTLLSMSTLILLLYRRRTPEKIVEVPNKSVSRSSKSLAVHRSFSLHNQLLHKENMEDGPVFESDGLLIFGVEQIEEATGYFDETKKIGEGGYGSVYFGVIGEKEVAVKKMRSNSTKEFFAELKVLCKIHHINVVELLGYASGDDHLYLVYEYIQNGSLSEHLHDPLLKGHQPLSWTARTQIALDAAKGIEYIHDHTKARYVHRDIKTSNILLDEGLRAKVADFGLAKLVGRTNEEDIIATRLVGTPGYLPPESVKELQVTHKTDVFAFGVVLAELITGQRALFRDNREPEKMKSLIIVIKKIFQDEDPESALEAATDGNLRSNYPMEDIFKMAEIAEWCLSEEAVERPEMREIVVMLSQIMVSSIEWEASLGGNSQVFSGVFNGR